MTDLGEASAVPTETFEREVHRGHAERILRRIVEHGHATRSDLAAATGLGRGTVAGLTARLVDAGVLRPVDSDDGRGSPLTLVAGDRLLVTVGLGVDDAIATISDLRGAESARFTAPRRRPQVPVGVVDDNGGQPDDAAARSDGASDALDALAAVLGRAIARAERMERRIVDLVVLVDGVVAGNPPVVVADDALGLEPVDLLAALRARTPALVDLEPTLPLPPTLMPAAIASAVAEHAALPDVNDLLYLDGDLGVESAIITDGRLLRGAHGLAAQLAHLPVVPGGVRCRCGQRGCLATVASPDVVLERAGLEGFAAKAGHRAALDELVARIDDADDRARWSWLDAALWIGRALQVVVPAVDPAMIVVGGYWGRLLPDIESAFRENRPTIGGGALSAIPTMTAGRSTESTAVTGARRQALDRLLADPLLLAG